MKKQLVFGLALVAVAASWGCNDDIKVEHRTFEQLCINSGGTYEVKQLVDGSVTKFCSCQGMDCDEGVICTNNGEFCANTELGPCNAGDANICKMNSSMIATIFECRLADDNTYKYMRKENDNCLNSCKADNTCGDCVDKNTRCGVFNDGDNSSTGLQTCERGVWKLTRECSCLTDSVCGECEEGEQKCRNGMYYLCANNSWSITACPNNVSCNAEGTECKCKNGDQRCTVVDNENIAIVEICEKGEWVKRAQCDKPACDMTGKLCEECDGTTTSCVNDANTGIGVFYECKENNWSNSTCLNGVSCNGEQCGECHDGDTKCEDGQLSTCKEGKWGEAEACPEGVSCNLEHTACEECNNSEIKCESGVRMRCVNNQWSAPEICDYGCNDITKNCNECSNGSIKCDNGIHSTCQNGVWVEDKSDYCLECKGDERQCENGISFTCIKGKKVAAISCDYGCLEDNSNCKECSNDSIKCENGVYSSCQDGLWVKDESNPYCLECEGSGKQCKNDISFVCEKGKKIAATKCEFGCFDDVSCKECNKGERKCMKGGMYECNDDGQWIADNDGVCKYGCADTVSCAECNSGDNECTLDEGVNKSRKCVNGKWSSYEKCSANVSCTYDGKCGVCENGKTDCSENMLRKCENGLWGEKVQCAMNLGCAENECAECRNDSTQCVTENTYTRCVKGKWSTTAENCPSGNYCLNGICRNACTEADTMCADSIKYECKDKKMTTTPCPQGNSCKDCDDGKCEKCGDCVNGTRIYDEKNSICSYKLCSYGEWGESKEDPQKRSCLRNAEGEYSGFGECKNGSTIFVNVSDVCVKKTCSEGKYDSQIEPHGYSCNNNLTDFGVCKTGTIECRVDGAYSKLFTCVGGDWQSSICTALNECTSDYKHCKDCNDKQTKCSNGMYYTCSGGLWSEPSVCVNNASCKSNEECGECKNGDLGCFDHKETGNARPWTYRCDSGTYVAVTRASDNCDKKSCSECSETSSLPYITPLKP